MGNHKIIMKKIKKALISVSDKKNLGSLLKILAKHKMENQYLQILMEKAGSLAQKTQ